MIARKLRTVDSNVPIRPGGISFALTCGGHDPLRRGALQLGGPLVLDYDRLRNRMTPVSTQVFFASVRLGEELKQPVLSRYITRLDNRFFGVLDFS
jgi:hypothetical protein